MKKRLFSLCIMLTAMTVSMRAGVKIDATHFPDENFRKCLSDKRIDQNQDGYLNDEELDAVKELNLNNKGIKDLKGIEYFLELRELECHENELTSIDVSMQYNLKWFDCSYNKLTTLDVSRNPVLGALYCFSNKLTALDVSKNKYLTELYIAGNQIVGDAMRDLVLGMHDVNEGTAEFGVCFYGVSPDNIITVPQVNLAKDAGWRVMIHNDSGWVDYAGASPGIEISSVNFPDDNFRHIVESKAIDRDLNGFLTDDELKMATELALSKKNIKNLKGLEFFTYLMDLECANNNLTSLDITKNTELTRLDCSYNSLTSLDLSKNTKLKEVFCFSNKLTALDLSKNKNLGWLWIAGNQIEGDAMLKLVLSLPDRTEPKGELGACVEGASPDNVITVQQASLAKDKGWRVLRRGDTKWEDYDGVPTETSLIGTVFEYEDVNYKIGENNTASVTRTKDITGPILIQAYVPYKGVNYTVTSIENSAFDKGHQDKSITMVVIPPTIKVIEGEAFIDLYGLTGVYIADVAAWCNIIFKGEKSNPLEYAHHLFLTTTSEEITDLVIPEGVTNIERAAFYCCSGLKSVTIPNSVKSIGNIAFKGCSGIENVYSNIKVPFAIPNNAFEGEYTAKLTVPAGTKSAYQSATGWKNFTNIVEPSLVGTVFEYDGINYRIGENNTVAVTRTKDITGVILIPSFVIYNGVEYTVTSIEDSAFDKNHQDYTVTKVAIPSTVKSIGGEAFIDLYGLTGVYISDVAAWCNIIFGGYKSNPLEYAHHLFLTTTSEEITDLVIPEGVTTINRAAFYGGSGLKSVTIPNSVKSIDVIAFSGCSGLENVYSMIETPFAIPDNAFEGAYSATLRVPIGKKSAYQSTDGWKNFSNILEENYSGEPLGLDINATNFPDAFFRSVVSGKEIDLNQDGYLSDAELAITSLDVTGKNIKDLKGIEFFTALTQLYCSANELTSLDVSKNTALTLLYCNVNNLTSLDVSNNMALITLNCADNYLVSLDVSKNLALTELYCQGNDIAEGGMDLLINSLPITNGVLYVSMKGNSPENVITVEHVKIANDKGWKVMGSNGEDWVEFTPDGIISVYNSGDANGVWYNLNGQRVEKPGKGLYIQNGKKVIIGR